MSSYRYEELKARLLELGAIQPPKCTRLGCSKEGINMSFTRKKN